MPPFTKTFPFAFVLFATALNAPAQTTSPAATRPAITLNVGDPAPAFKTGGFVQGGEFSTFEKGHVYVLEFWATWCGPCIGQMPHLSQLSEKYKGKVTFVGLDGLEHKEDDVEPDTMSLVKHFMETHPGRMTYDVAIDTADHHMVKSWFRAAGQEGIPCTFIVDQMGEIAWIGLPMQMEEPLAGVVAGTFDGKKYMADQAAAVAILKPIYDASAAKNYVTVLSLIAALEKDHPELLPHVTTTRFVALLHNDPNAAKAQFSAVIEAHRADDAVSFAECIATTPQLSPDMYATAADLLKQSLAASGETDKAAAVSKTITLNNVLFNLYNNSGNASEALKFADQALDLAKANHYPEKIIGMLKQHVDGIKAQPQKAAAAN